MAIEHNIGDALAASAWLANSIGPPDKLQSPDDLREFMSHHAYTGRIDGDQAEVEEVRSIRGQIREILTAERDAVADLTNPVLSRYHAIPRLVRHGERDWHFHSMDGEGPLAERMLVYAAWGMATLIVEKEESRIGLCAADGCNNVVVDLTKNRSRIFCSTACTNRVAAAAYRARKRRQTG